MTKLTLVLMTIFLCAILEHQLVQAYPADVEAAEIMASPSVGEKDADLKPAETFGFGYYPAGIYGGGYGGLGSGAYGHGGYNSYGYGYGRRWGYGSGWGGYYRHPPIYPNLWG